LLILFLRVRGLTGVDHY